MKLPREVFNIQSIRNLFIAGLAVWAIVSISYFMLSLLIKPLQPHNGLIIYCAVTTFILSLVAIILFSNYQLSSNFKSYGNLLSYTVVIFLITNGIQAVYASIQAPRDGIDENQHAELIPFLDARPWLPPAGMRNDLSYLTITSERLNESKTQLTASLDSVQSRLQSCGLMTDSIFLTVVPTSREIGKGGTYRSEVVLAARLDKSYVKRVSVNKTEVQLISGIGVFEENTGSLNQRTRNLTYEAEIELYGESKLITTLDSYQIIKPFIEFSSQSVNSLFLNCGNQLNIQVPILGSDYRPTFKVNGGSFKYGSEPGRITVLPTSRNVDIDVYNQQAMIGRKTFPVRRIPAPSIRPLVNGKQIDLNRGISKSSSALSLSVHPDTDFQRILPKDANYRVQDCEISLVSNGKVRSRMKGKANSNITTLTRRANAGDQLRVEIKTVLRKNFKGDIERVTNFYPKFFLIPLN